MTGKKISAFDALIVRQAFEKLADSVTFSPPTQRELRQAAYELAEKAACTALAARGSDGGREGSLQARNSLDRSRSNVPLHPGAVTLGDGALRSVAGPMHRVIFGDLTETSLELLHDAIAAVIAPQIPAASVDEVADAIVQFVLTRRDLVELAREFPELTA